MQVTKFAIPEIIFGSNSLEYVVPCAQRNGAKKVLLISDTGIEEAGWVKKLLDLLESCNLNWVYYNTVDSNPKNHQIEEGAKFYLQQKADVILALGGGSPMDTAKGIALVASNGGKIEDFEGANRIQNPLPPMIFIPTTAGSGADISQFAIITNVKRQVKMAIISRTLVPNISIIDPLFLETKPTWLIIASAIDALAHAIESYVSVLATPFTETQSLKAINMIMRNLETALSDNNLESLTNLCVASTSAGMAFSNASLGVDHAIAHSLGGKYDVMHGLMHPVLLPAVMRFNLPACREKMAKIGEIVAQAKASNEEETAYMGIQTLESFFKSLDIPLHLRALIPDKSQLREACQVAVQDACILTNPKQVTWEDCLNICERVW